MSEEIDLQLVLNGEPVPMRVSPMLSATDLIRRVLKQRPSAASWGDWREWEIRLAHGEQVQPHVRLRDLPSGPLFMNLRAGVGA